MSEATATNGAAVQEARLPVPHREPSQQEALFALDQRKAAMFAVSPLVPDHLRKGSREESIANCYIAMTIARELRQNPLIVMQNIYFVHGKPGWNASYMIANANASGKFKDPIDWEIKGSGANLEVTAFATVAATGRRVEASASMKMAQAEGWAKNSKYQTMPEQMLKYRAATFLVRLYCPEVMLGYRTNDELEDVLAAQPDGTPYPSRTAALESKLGIPETPTEVVDAEGEIIGTSQPDASEPQGESAVDPTDWTKPETPNAYSGGRKK